MAICVPKRPVPITATFWIFCVIGLSFSDLEKRDGKAESSPSLSECIFLY
jgi:hypothetical protein